MLVAVFLDRVLDTLELAERTAMEVTVANLNSALNIQLAAQMLKGTPLDRATLIRRNPFELADMRMSNLHPDLKTAAELAQVEPGNWVFDPSRNELIYLPIRHRGLRTSDAQPALRFRLLTADGRSYAVVPAVEFSWQ